MVDGGGAFLAWLGATFIVLSDGRRGLALGAFVAAAGIALASYPTAGVLGAAALGLGGAIAAAGRLRTGPEGWAIMPPGSTPRLVLCVAGGFVALWVALAVMSGDDGSLRFAVIVLVGLAGARALASEDTPTVLTAAAMIALAVAAATGLATESPNVVPYALAGGIAAASSWIPIRRPRAA